MRADACHSPPAPIQATWWYHHQNSGVIIIIIAVVGVVNSPGGAALQFDTSPLRPEFRGRGPGSNPSSCRWGGVMWNQAVQRGSPCVMTRATSTCGEERHVCSVAHLAGCQGGHPAGTNGLLFSAWVPSWARFPSLPRPLALGASSQREFPDQPLLLGSRSLLPTPLPGNGARRLPNMCLESAWSLVLGVTDVMMHIHFQRSPHGNQAGLGGRELVPQKARGRRRLGTLVGGHLRDLWFPPSLPALTCGKSGKVPNSECQP